MSWKKRKKKEKERQFLLFSKMVSKREPQKQGETDQNTFAYIKK